MIPIQSQPSFLSFSTTKSLLLLQTGRKRSLRDKCHRLFSEKHPHGDDTISQKTSTWFCNVVQGPAILKTCQHRPTPSMIHLPGLRSLPFWTRLLEPSISNSSNPKQNHTLSNNNPSTQFQNQIAFGDPILEQVVQWLEQHVDIIRDEYLQYHEHYVSDYHIHSTEHHTTTLHQGQWDWHSYMTKGKIQANFFQQFPQTFAILQHLRHNMIQTPSGEGSSNTEGNHSILFEGTPFGYSFFSKLYPQSKIQPHTAPINFRLRLHLPLIVPDETQHEQQQQQQQVETNDNDKMMMRRPSCGIRVGSVIKPWTAGKAMIFDDSYEHEVWNDTTDQIRVLLLLDLWHPDVTMQERRDITHMFHQAREQGWYTN